MARALTRVVLWRSLIDVMESVTLRAKLCSQEIVYRVLRVGDGDRQVRLPRAGRNSHILRSFRASPPFTIPGTRSSARR